MNTPRTTIALLRATSVANRMMTFVGVSIRRLSRLSDLQDRWSRFVNDWAGQQLTLQPIQLQSYRLCPCPHCTKP